MNTDPADPADGPPDPAVAGVPVATVRRRKRRRRRGLGIAAVLTGCVGAVLLAGALVAESEPAAAAAAPRAETAQATTPLLSARRAPGWTTQLMANRALVAAMAPIAAEAPPNTCVGVGDGTSTVYAHNTTSALVPASNQKILTAAAALDMLGADTTLDTTFVATAPPADGVLAGDLYMVGGGDPLLTTEAYQLRRRDGRLPETDLEGVADQLVAAGVRQINGSVVGDASRYDAQRTVPGWAERWLTNGTVAPLSALTVNDAWLIDPTTGDGPGAPAPDPAVHAAGVLAQLLVERGVIVNGWPESGTAPPGAHEVLRVPSLTVAGLVDEVLSYSDNTSAELLLKEIGRVVSGEGSTAAGAAAVSEWAASHGLPAEGHVVGDGSGLSSTNRVSCELLASILRSDGSDGTVADSLAVPGQPGTLNKRFGGEEWPLRLRAKTGSLNEVTALSGWLATRPGAVVDFQIITNTEGRRVQAADIEFQTRILTALLDQPQAPPVEQAGPLPITEA